MGKITGNAQGEKGLYKPPLYNGLREVRVVSVIRTINCVGLGTEGDPVRNEWQYWTEEGEEITTNPKRLDHFMWLRGWVELYESENSDGYAQNFLDWVNSQPMTTG